jgi:hypothetical protein
MLSIRRDHVVDIGGEDQLLLFALAFLPHGNRDEGGIRDRDRHLLDRRDQKVASVPFAPEHGGEQLDERLPLDLAALVEPGAVPRDGETAVSAIINVWQCRRARFAANLL